MERFLVTFEGPSRDLIAVGAAEAAWDEWVEHLASRGLRLVNDLDPVNVAGHFETYEAVALGD